MGEVARLFFESGALTLCTFVSPYQSDRSRVRSLIPDDRFVEVFVDVDVETARQRDPKGLYAKSDAGEIENLTGVSAPYERPGHAEITVDTGSTSADEAAAKVIEALTKMGVVS